MTSNEYRAARLSEASQRYRLTLREVQVASLLIDGLTNEGIAARLVLSVETAKSHVRHVLAKMGAHSRAEAVSLLLLPPEEIEGEREYPNVIEFPATSIYVTALARGGLVTTSDSESGDIDVPSVA